MANDSQSISNQLGEVRKCDCGGVNLVMGPMTLHFAADEFHELAELVSAAIPMLDSDTPTAPAPQPEPLAAAAPVKKRPKSKTTRTFH